MRNALFSFSAWRLVTASLLSVAFTHSLISAEETVSAKASARFVISQEGSGRATSYGEANKIVTLGDKTHVAWLDAIAEGFRVRIRTLDRRTGEWSPVVNVGDAMDNHGGPALTADSQGYLHIIYYPHHRPFRYRRSLRPNDASAWGPEIQFGESLSYPVVLCAPDDTLILTCRRYYLDKSQPNEVELWKKTPGGEWQRQQTILRSRTLQYAHFQESMAWGADGKTIHLSCRIYETSPKEGETPFQTVGYLMSPDLGKTWQRRDGTTVSLPANADTVDILASGGGSTGRALYAGPLAVNQAGVPYLLYSSRNKDGARTYLCSPDASGGWTQRDMHTFLPDAWRSYDLAMVGAVTFSQSGRGTVVASVVKLGPGEIDWAHPSSEIARFWSDDGMATFKSEILQPTNPAVSHWMPNLERATGHHAIPHEPGIISIAGPAGAGLHDLVLNNGVIWQPRNP